MAAMNPSLDTGTWAWAPVRQGGFLGVTGVKCLPRLPRGRQPN